MGTALCSFCFFERSLWPQHEQVNNLNRMPATRWDSDSLCLIASRFLMRNTFPSPSSSMFEAWLSLTAGNLLDVDFGVVKHTTYPEDPKGIQRSKPGGLNLNTICIGYGHVLIVCWSKLMVGIDRERTCFLCLCRFTSLTPSFLVFGIVLPCTILGSVFDRSMQKQEPAWNCHSWPVLP